MKRNSRGEESHHYYRLESQVEDKLRRESLSYRDLFCREGELGTLKALRQPNGGEKRERQSRHSGWDTQ